MFLRHELEILEGIVGKDAHLYQLAKQEQCRHNVISKRQGIYTCEDCQKQVKTVEDLIRE